jgi:Autotransporter beta-domain
MSTDDLSDRTSAEAETSPPARVDRRASHAFLAIALAAFVCGPSHRALASAGCDAVNAGGFNASLLTGAFSNLTISGFAVGDTLSFVINISNSGTWQLNTGNNTLVGLASLTATKAYTVKGTNGDTTLKEGNTDYAANYTVTASCTSAPPTPNNSVTPTPNNNLGAMVVSTMPLVAQLWGQSLVGVTTGAIGAGFSGNPLPFTPTPNGFTYYFTADPEADRNVSEADSVNRFLASPDGRVRQAITDDFSALGYAGPLKAPASNSVPHDWLAWIDVRGTNLNDNAAGGDLHGNQIDMIAGVTRRLSSSLVVGSFAGYETFDYNSLALAGTLKGNGWTTGGYVGWYFAPQLRFEGTVAGAYVGADSAADDASGSFTGARLLTSGTVVGTYDWRAVKLEPSAQIFGVWEHDNSFTDSTGTQQPGVSFSTGRGAVGGKASYPFLLTRDVTMAPYAGLYGDYYFSQTNASLVGLTPIPLLQGWGVRGTGGVAFNLFSRAQLTAGGEYEVTADNFQIWTWNVAGHIPF